MEVLAAPFSRFRFVDRFVISVIRLSCSRQVSKPLKKWLHGALHAPPLPALAPAPLGPNVRLPLHTAACCIALAQDTVCLTRLFFCFGLVRTAFV